MKISRVSEMRAMDRTAIERYGISPELLMENLPEGPERTYISRLLITSQFLKQYDQENMAENMAEEMLVWLVRYRFKKEIQQVSEEIHTAHELLHRKAELNKYLASMNIGDN